MSDILTESMTETGSKSIVEPTKQPFEELIPFIQKQIGHRRRKWTLTTMDFEEASQILLIRVWQKYHLFDPARAPFEHWLNRTLSNGLRNILRDNLLRWQRPCIRDGGCVHNLGMGHCSYTKSGNQCIECPLYSEWKNKREGEYNIRSSLALDHHAQEVSSIQGDFLDIEAAKKVIDEKMLSRLTPWERRIYRWLWIDHLAPLQVVEKLKKVIAKRKRPLDPTDAVDYQAILKLSQNMKTMMKDIIVRYDLAN